MTRAVLRAAGDGDLDELDRLLRSDPSLANAVGDNPYWGGRVQPLHLAAAWSQVEAVERLLAAGADPSGSNDGYGDWSPLMVAVSRGAQTIVGRLIDAGARLGPFELASLGDVDRLRELVAADPTMAGRACPDGTTLLHVAADSATARLLLAAGANPRAVDEYGGTPLDAATRRRGREDEEIHALVATLVEAGAEADACTFAAIGDLPKLALALDAEPAALDRPGACGSPPLHAAAAQGRRDAVVLLLDRGANPNARDSGGVCPLHAVSGAPTDELEIMRLLLDAGADPTARDGVHDATPTSWAGFQRRRGLERALEEASRGWSG